MKFDAKKIIGLNQKFIEPFKHQLVLAVCFANSCHEVWSALQICTVLLREKKCWRAGMGSNHRCDGLQPTALPAELPAH